MKERLDKLVYPGVEQYSQEELAAPGSIPVELHGEPLVTVVDTAYIMFRVPDLEKQKAFLMDFGMQLAHETDKALYMRGYGRAPYIYVAHKGVEAAFLGAGFLVASMEDLQLAACATGLDIEEVDGPGAGWRVRLTDPDGFLVDLVHGRTDVSPLSTRRAPLPVNTPHVKKRINSGQRPALEPSAVERFGHYVLSISDFEQSWLWYRRHLGVLPTDVLCTHTGRPVLAFSRLNKGDKPADHHTVVLVEGGQVGCLHSAYETLDHEAIGQRQQFLKMKGWQHYWGIGRHILGSQIFDYWLDPFGNEVEHYADGDVFDSRYPTQYHLFDRGGLWAWGQDLPPESKPKPGLKEVIRLLLGGHGKRMKLLELKKAVDRAPRPWLN